MCMYISISHTYSYVHTGEYEMCTNGCLREIDPCSHMDDLRICTCVCLCLTHIDVYIWMNRGYVHMDVCER